MADDKEKLTKEQIDKIKAQIINSGITETGGSGSIGGNTLMPGQAMDVSTPKEEPVSFSNAKTTATSNSNEPDLYTSSIEGYQETNFAPTPESEPVVESTFIENKINEEGTPDIFTKRDNQTSNDFSNSNESSETNAELVEPPVATAKTETTVESKKINFDRTKSLMTPGRKTIAGIIGVIALLIAGLFMWNQSQNNVKQTPMPAGFAAAGVYVDDAVPTIDFKYLKSQGVDFVYLKATVGDQKVSDNYQSRLTNAQKEGLETGAVLVYNPDSSAYDQYDFLINKIGNDVGRMPIAIQINASAVADEDTQNNLVQLVQLISAEYNNQVIVKTTQDGIDILEDVFEKTNFWVIANGTDNQDVRNTLIQFNESKQIGDGVKVIKLPTSVFNGPENEWKELIGDN